jgi:choline dehydrogenase
MNVKDKLTVKIGALATKVFSEGKGEGKPRAVEVEFLDDGGVYKATSGYDPARAPNAIIKRGYARKEVTVSGGTFNSLQLLQLSGICEQKHLEFLGIKAIVDLPGVREAICKITRNSQLSDTARATLASQMIQLR